jgi:prepilin-type N-terminal cleavage/methylation domain-containing protein
MPSRRPQPAGYSLVELLMVITLMSIAAALALPSVNPGIHDQLQGAAEIVAGDLAYARGLAVTNNGTYRFTFDLAHNSYTLTYSGADPALATLPSNPFQAPGSDPTQYVVSLGQLPSLGGSVQLAAVGTSGGNPTPQTTIEFGPYGSTTQAAPTAVWLSAGAGVAERFISVSVNPVTGLATIGPFQGSGPPAVIMGAGS